MNEKYDFEDNIEFFNANFECDNEEQILDLYKVTKTTENNDVIAKKIVKEKYNHPLFLNYNYCLFCLERRKTKYNQQNLDDMHNSANIKTICDFLEKEQISLIMPKNKNEKLSKRRFIHSCEPINKKIIENKQDYDSDTELYIDNNNDNNENLSEIYYFKKMKSNAKSNKFSSSKQMRKVKQTTSKKLSYNYDIDSSFEKETNINGNNADNININNSILRKTEKIKNTKTFWNVNKSLSKKNVILRSSAILKKTKKEETENIIFNSERKSFESSNKPFSSVFGKITNYFYKDNEINNNDEKNDETEGSFQCFEKNEKCGICLDEIKDKFTLICGDFFCRQCIVSLLEDKIDNISEFEKMECPRCHELINESTIKFLLKNDYLIKYNKIKTRIEGLKNKNYVPCPHPDCEGFALKEKLIDGILECQNGHLFCYKCLEELSSKDRLQPKNHVCIDKYPKTSKFLGDNKNIRKCPQCKSWIQRDAGGCNWFICNNIWCQFKFCWICGKQCDSFHYKNPLSMCFGLVDSDYKGKMIKSLRMRRIRCILIALLLLILLPIICIGFSFFLIGFFVFVIQFDGKEIRNVTFHSKPAQKAFYIFYFSFIFCICLALIPFGYICLVILLLSIPILLIINKIRKKKANDF